MARTAREELGETDAPVEDEVAQAFDRIVDEGAQRLHRSWREVLTTGLAGGLEVATGVVALLATYAATGSHLLAGLAFSIGFIALMLAKSELFTDICADGHMLSRRGRPSGLLRGALAVTGRGRGRRPSRRQVDAVG